MRNPDCDFWNGKKVLLTGHSGFKGSWMTHWLRRMGANVTGLSLAPETRPSLFAALRDDRYPLSEYVDIRDEESTIAAVQRADPEIVFHLAAQSLVRKGYQDPWSTFQTNVQGTANLLEALKRAEKLRTIIIVTTDKVYANPEHGKPFVESDALGGQDPYSASKAAAECVVAGYRAAIYSRRLVGIATARAGNVIGGGDWSSDRLLPDAVRAWSKNSPVRIRRPDAVRPWQHVLEPLAGYLLMAEQLWIEPDSISAMNFGPDCDANATVGRVLNLAGDRFGFGELDLSDLDEGPHEANLLSLNADYCVHLLRHKPRWNLEAAVHRTMDWYLEFQNGSCPRDLCDRDIDAFLAGFASDLKAA